MYSKKKLPFKIIIMHFHFSHLKFEHLVIFSTLNITSILACITQKLLNGTKIFLFVKKKCFV